jgi:hypothetical protein
VFWRDMGWNEEDEAVEAREGVCNMTDMLAGVPSGAIGDGQAARPEAASRWKWQKFGACQGARPCSLMSRALFIRCDVGENRDGLGENLLLRSTSERKL